MAKKHSPSQSFPSTFDFGDGNSTRVRRAVEAETENKLERTMLNTPSLNNHEKSKFLPKEDNQSPILFIDDESAGIIDVTKTTTVNKVLQGLS